MGGHDRLEGIFKQVLQRRFFFGATCCITNFDLDPSGIEDFRWHDLRHTWASWLTQNGVPLNIIQEMGAWESAEMVRRYAHLAPEQFARHAKVVDDVLNDTNLTQPK